MPLACILNAPSPTSFLIPVIRCLLFLGFPVDFVEPMNDGMQVKEAPGRPLERVFTTRYFAGRLHATLFDVRDEGASLVSGTSFKMKCLCEVSERVSPPSLAPPHSNGKRREIIRCLRRGGEEQKGSAQNFVFLLFLADPIRRLFDSGYCRFIGCPSVFPAPFHFPFLPRPLPLTPPIGLYHTSGTHRKRFTL